MLIKTHHFLLLLLHIHIKSVQEIESVHHQYHIIPVNRCFMKFVVLLLKKICHIYNTFISFTRI